MLKGCICACMHYLGYWHVTQVENSEGLVGSGHHEQNCCYISTINQLFFYKTANLKAKLVSSSCGYPQALATT